MRIFAKKCLICTLCIVLSLCINNLCLDINASAKNSVEPLPSTSLIHRHRVEATAVDKTDSTSGFHVTVNVANNSSSSFICDEPVSWTLEYQILRSDYTLYTSGSRTGIFYSSVASQSEDFYVGSLKYGCLKYRVVMVSHGEVTYSDWKECYASPNGGGGGQHRIRAA